MKPNQSEVAAMIMVPGVQYHGHRIFIELMPTDNPNLLSQRAARDFAIVMGKMTSEAGGKLIKAAGGQILPLS